MLSVAVAAAAAIISALRLSNSASIQIAECQADRCSGAPSLHPPIIIALAGSSSMPQLPAVGVLSTISGAQARSNRGQHLHRATHSYATCCVIRAAFHQQAAILGTDECASCGAFDRADVSACSRSHDGTDCSNDNHASGSANISATGRAIASADGAADGVANSGADWRANDGTIAAAI